MAKDATFPATDVPDRTARILEVLRTHDPVPVPVTALYLAIEDKRALADEFARVRKTGLMEQVVLQPGEPHYDAATALANIDPAAGQAALPVFRLTESGRSGGT